MISVFQFSSEGDSRSVQTNLDEENRLSDQLTNDQESQTDEDLSDVLDNFDGEIDFGQKTTYQLEVEVVNLKIPSRYDKIQLNKMMSHDYKVQLEKTGNQVDHKNRDQIHNFQHAAATLEEIFL